MKSQCLLIVACETVCKQDVVALECLSSFPFLSYYLPFAQRVTLQRIVGHHGLNGPIVLHRVGGASSSAGALAIVSITTVRAPRCRPETATYRSVTSDVS